MTTELRDRQYLWHPYSQHGWQTPTLKVSSASGAYLTLEDGRKILDAVSSWWVTLHGHAHPKIAEAIAKQARQLEQVIFAGFTHEPAVRLAETLIMTMRERGTQLARVFYSDNGSTAVETALKMAYQFHRKRGDQKRQRFLALRHGYHGDTFGAMMVSDPNGFHSDFKNFFPHVDFVEPDDFEGLKIAVQEDSDNYAAFILEPMIQGAEGMRIYSAEFLREVRNLCSKHGIFLICDEVFTGFYRTGTAFAFEHARIAPDIICLSKGLSGGFLPFAATLCTEEMFSAFVSDELSEAFLHGHSYTANPLGCAAALASWNLLHETACQDRIQRIAALTREEIEKLSSHPAVVLARSIGTIGAVSLRTKEGYFAPIGRKVFPMAIEEGVLLRALGNVLYAVPPYCVTDEEMKRIYAVMAKVIDRLELA
ncbi:MAG TPA: adenosylmethionine--8-amino-7-oxononanoate transaminase [Bdellovibrionota bacterium]|nr:adenosylmethionine--8-amino-7-oxononanoate transaminase [Bdellovibrionota bacterium]